MFITKMRNKIRLNAILKPLNHFNQWFYGKNYKDQITDQLIFSQGMLFSSTINLIGDCEFETNSDEATPTVKSIKIVGAYPIEITITLWILGLLTTDFLLVYKFKNKKVD